MRIAMATSVAGLVLAGTWLMAIVQARTEESAPFKPFVSGVLYVGQAVNTVRPEPVNITSLRLAIADLMKTFPKEYAAGKEYLARLDALESLLAKEGRRPQHVRALEKLRREALLANPLLDFDRLLLVRRRPVRGDADRTYGWNMGFPRSSTGNSSVFRYHALATPYVLPAGHYKMAAFSGDGYYTVFVPYSSTIDGLTVGLGYATGTVTGLAYPSSGPYTSSSGYFRNVGGNFMVATPIPEPATLAMLLTGLIALAALGWRSRR